MKNKKGFTLIEVLAVIIILAVILVIIAPKINEYYKDSVKRKNLQSAYGVRNAINQYFASTTGTFMGYTCEFPDNCSEITLDGSIPTGGTVTITANGIIFGFIRYGDNVFIIDDDGVTAVEYVTSPGDVIDFAYSTSGEQTYMVTDTGYYKLEVWGAQGGDGNSSRKGGYGGYSSGSVYLTAGTKLYVNVGGKGITNSTLGVTVAGGYNGGGENTASQWGAGSSGGGATHIALSSGTLASFDTNENGVADSNEIGNILIVAGGGGGSGVENGGSRYVLGGAAGGFKGNSSSIEDYEHIYGIVSGATQSTGYAFGQGGPTSSWSGGGGGGFYGGLGKTSTYFGGSGGSGYIGYSDLNNGVMYCYNCEENGDAGTRTISTTGSNKDSVNCPSSYSSSALSNCAKSGNGYAVITYIGESLN